MITVQGQQSEPDRQFRDEVGSEPLVAGEPLHPEAPHVPKDRKARSARREHPERMGTIDIVSGAPE